jgi:hypothetical protein
MHIDTSPSLVNPKIGAVRGEKGEKEKGKKMKKNSIP